MTKKLVVLLLALAIVACAGNAAKNTDTLVRIDGFKEGTSEVLLAFFKRHEATQGRKVAVFDFDGTLVGQVPYYAADELFIFHSENGLTTSKDLPDIPGIEPSLSVIEKYLAIDKNVGHEFALGWRVKIYKGHKISTTRKRAMTFYSKYYLKKIFEPMRRLVQELLARGFEVWVVTGSPEFYVDTFIPRYFGIHPSRVIGTKTIVHDGMITEVLAGAVTEKDGKVDAIETIIKAQPLFVAGNSMGDVNMLKYSRDLSLVINPVTQLRDIAGKNGWLVEELLDKPLPNATHYYKKYSISPNP